MKIARVIIFLIVGILICSPIVYANDLNISGDMELSLNPYKNFKNEGQISSNDIIITNDKDVPQMVSFRLVDKGNSNIALKDKSVLYHDFKEEKAAFVHIRNIYSGEKFLVYNENEPCKLGVINPNETLSFEICGELNISALWEENDSLELNIIFSSEEVNVNEIKTIDSVASGSAIEILAENEQDLSQEDAISDNIVEVVCKDEQCLLQDSVISGSEVEIAVDDEEDLSQDSVISGGAVGIVVNDKD